MAKIRKLDGANMDIDLTSGDVTSWKQDKCPWNEKEATNSHRCCIKSTSICEYFCGIKYPDFVLCCYPNANPHEKKEKS